MIRKNSAIALALLLLGVPVAGAAERVLTVFGAASLTNVLQEIGDSYTAESKVQVRFSFAASSALARQIESGAPADVFMSADQEWMDYLQSRNLIAPATRANVVTNTLVLIGPADSRLTIRIGPNFPLVAALGDRGRVATGDPASVPVGKYAKAALTSLGVWSSVASRIVAADNVRTALNFVSRGEAPVGIVYSTDAKSESKVKILDTFPASSHDPITYPAAATSTGGPAAAAFMVYLRGPAARAAFTKAGFGIP
ncbi:MAG: molybdate ABC transporter substrate-binding protein [Pseudomonadota bacterium]